MSKSQPQRKQRVLQAAYRDDGLTMAYLSRTLKKDKRSLAKQLFDVSLVPARVHYPRKVLLILDVHFFSRHFGIAVAFDAYRSEPIYETFVWRETVSVYITMLRVLCIVGYDIVAIVVDGRRGVKEQLGALFRIPVQLCHFHQIQAGVRYLGKYPKTEAAKDLLRLYRSIGSSSHEKIEANLAVWAMEYDDLLAERTIHPSGRWSYTHRRLRSAGVSLRRNLPYLYTYRQYPELAIPNTTNPLDGGVFSPMKTMLKTHRGLNQSHQNSLVLSFLRRENR